MVQRRASGAILRNGGYGDLFAMLAAGQLREMAPRGARVELTLKYPPRECLRVQIIQEFF